MIDHLAELRSSTSIVTRNRISTAIDIGSGQDIELTSHISDSSLVSFTSDVNAFDTINNILDNIDNGSRRIKRLTEIKRSGLPDQQRNAQREVDDLVAHLTPEIRQCKQLLDTTKQNLQSISKTKSAAIKHQFNLNMLNSQTRRFQKSLITYQNSTKIFKNCIKQDFARQAKIVNPEITQTQIQEMLESDNPHKYLEDNIMKLSYDVLDEINELENEHKRVHKLEKSILEIQELFNACALLVSETQEKLNNIEANVNETKVEIEKGVVQIRKAEKYKKMSRKANMKCMIILFIIIAIGVVFLLYWLGLFDSKTQKSES